MAARPPEIGCLVHLPSDLIIRCARFLHGRNVCMLQCTSKLLQQVTSEKDLWRMLAGDNFPCRTALNPKPDWRGIYRACLRGNGAWQVLIIDCAGVEVPIPYESTTKRNEMLEHLVRLFHPDDEVSFASLWRAGPPPGELIAVYSSESALACVTDGGVNVHECEGVMGDLRLPAVSHAVMSVSCNHDQLDAAVREHVHKCAHRRCTQVSIWCAGEQGDAQYGGDGLPTYTSVWITENGTVGQLRQAVLDTCGATDVQLYVADIGAGRAERSPEVGGAVVQGGKQDVLWGCTRMQMLAWEDTVQLKTGARVCSGEHVLALPRSGDGGRRVHASDTLEDAAKGSPVCFEVWVNVPKTMDYSVRIVAHPWSSVGDIIMHVARHHVWEGHVPEKAYLGLRELESWDVLGDIGVIHGHRLHVQCRHTRTLQGKEKDDIQIETEVELLYKHYLTVVHAPISHALGQDYSRACPHSSPSDIPEVERALLKGYCMERRGMPIMLPPFEGGASNARAVINIGETPRQFEYSPHVPGLMAMGSFRGKVSLLTEMGSTPKAGPVTSCSQTGEVLALNWLSRHSDLLLVGSCDVAGHSGSGAIDIMRVHPEDDTLKLVPHANRLASIDWVNSVCSNSTDVFFIAAGLAEVRLFDLETGALLQCMPHWHSAFVNCPKFANTHPFLIATASLDQTMCLWDARTSMRTACYRKELGWGGCMLCFSPTDDKILVSGDDGIVCQFTVSDGSVHSELGLQSIGEDEGNYTKSYYTADGRYAVSTGRLEDCLHICSAFDGELVESFQIKDKRPPDSMHLLTRTSRPDPFHPLRYSVLVDGWAPLPEDANDQQHHEATDAITLAYMLDLTGANAGDDEDHVSDAGGSSCCIQ